MLELTDIIPDEPAPEPEPLPDPFAYEPPPPPPRRPPPSMDDDRLMSEFTEEAASRAFSGLSGFRRGGPSLTGEGPIGRSDVTLEEIVHVLVRPILREWLDENLPTLVERLVKREIEKVVRRGLD
ncbi:uncharacterized protein DUF2497 [Nitrospirillum pindoramense]|uniref:Uncharacterized protein DUF2497 n=1 Tax=Nitrospirillum amazonense TaxID=28077 RepID=A0A560HD74_9PROT|nr:uncharacterized protein DUF2497 [Nitrospirillum amazonense]